MYQLYGKSMVGLVVSGQWSVVSFLEDYRGELGRRMRERGIGHYVNFGRGGLGRKKRKMLPLKKKFESLQILIKKNI